MVEILNLRAGYRFRKKVVRAVNNVCLKIHDQDFLGIAGESGCGKSTLVLAMLRLLKSPGYIESGKVLINGLDIFSLSNEQLSKVRWKEFSFVPQSSMSSLNPVMKIKDQIADAIVCHTDMERQEAYEIVGEVLKLVGIPVERANSYPHQLSGGMRQRVVIAMALALSPKFVVFDEPTTALDVVVQRSILEKIFELQEQKKFSAAFVTHDISLLFEISKHLAIMYAGEIVEYGDTRNVYENPLHPYAKGLIEALPSVSGELKEYKSIPGRPPDLSIVIEGCPFYERCRFRKKICLEKHPEYKQVEQGRWVSCHLY
ncbi:ABC transporter ATP-binding protein [Thermotoga profunda]|uniref:ABC transporter ATP-binding protein n=1 Tax=Thermotoga profunda TaxID=1508420 RepID=UPI000597E531|nr:ABC transporter ATP-binding protein [Thermotoga profunda]